MQFIKANELKNTIWDITNEHYVNYKADTNIDYSKESKLFSEALNSSEKEHDIQRYIKENEKWFIPYSLTQDYGLCNHGGAYFYKELHLGSEYIVDYALLGHNSEGYQLILVEFETPEKIDLLQKNINDWSVQVRKGLAQIYDWKVWIDKNKNYLLDSMNLSSNGINIQTTKFYYVLVVSRRECFDARVNEKRNWLSYEKNIKLVSYDRIVDNIEYL